MVHMADPLEIAASLATYAGFLGLLGLLSVVKRLSHRQLVRVVIVLLWGLAAINWIAAMMDTSVLHLAADTWWPEWSYWRRILWRHSQAGVILWCYADCLRWRRAQKREQAPAQKTGQPTAERL